MQLSLNGITVTIDSTTIVSDVDLVVRPGEMTALIGPNGSGKSTLLRTIFRSLRPTTGTVLLGDEDAWRIPARHAARKRAVVTQHQTVSTGFTVQEIVAMGRGVHQGLLDRETAQDRDIVTDALVRVDMTWATERMYATLSGGERQRVLVARALAQEAPLIVLDEPTNHLDVRAQLDLLELVQGLGVSTLAALHDLDHAAAYADQVAVLHRGRLVAVGKPLEVLEPGLIAEVFGVRAHIGPHPLSGRPHVAVAPMSETAHSTSPARALTDAEQPGTEPDPTC